jgi:hypothetical protein
MQVQPSPEHRWLQKLHGKWTLEVPEGNKPEYCPTGSEEFKPVGDIWVQGFGVGTMPDGSPSLTVMTLGFDPATGKVRGSWIGSMMTHHWVYEGHLDMENNRLVMESVGPDFEVEGKTKNYRDVIEFLSDDHRSLKGMGQNEDGTWTTFMEMHYRRVQ